MKIRLKTKMSLAFLLVMMIIVAFAGILANSFLTSQFRTYATDKINQKIDNVVELLSSRYEAWGNDWDISGLEVIGVNTLNDGLLIRLSDQSGAVIWDARVHNDGMCSAILESIALRMQTQNSSFQGGYVEKTYPLMQGGRQVGSVDIGYYGPYFYTDIDIEYLATLNRLLLMTAFAAIVLSIVLGVLFARQLTRPMTRVIETARSIAAGNTIDRITEKSSTKEISELTESINSLADTLGKQEHIRKQITSDVAHELRTPLTILQSHLEAMIDGTWQADRSRLENCNDEVVRISRLVGDLEKLTQLEQQSLVLDCQELDIAALLQRVVNNFQNDYAQKRVALVLAAEHETIAADADKLSQVFINLLSNALKYSNAGGKVTITTRSSADSLSIAINDTGIGISSEDLPNIFERFYRTDKSRARMTGGSGIGLTIAKAIVEAHHGKITVQSEPGRGSEFTVTLPR